MNKQFFLSSVINIDRFCTFNFFCFTQLILESQTPLKARLSVAVDAVRGDRLADRDGLSDSPANRLQKSTRTEPSLRFQKRKHPHGTENRSYHVEGKIPEGTASGV